MANEENNRQNHIIFAKRFIECVKFSTITPLNEDAGVHFCWNSNNRRDYCESKARELREKSYFIKKGFSHFNAFIHNKTYLMFIQHWIRMAGEWSEPLLWWTVNPFFLFNILLFHRGSKAEAISQLFITSVDVHVNIFHVFFFFLSLIHEREYWEISLDGTFHVRWLQVIISIFKEIFSQLKLCSFDFWHHPRAYLFMLFLFISHRPRNNFVSVFFSNEFQWILFHLHQIFVLMTNFMRFYFTITMQDVFILFSNKHGFSGVQGGFIKRKV